MHVASFPRDKFPRSSVPKWLVAFRAVKEDNLRQPEIIEVVDVHVHNEWKFDSTDESLVNYKKKNTTQ